MKSEVLRYDHVTKQYQNGAALQNAADDVCLTISSGDFVAITGPSGSGKSTLLHLGAGFDRPTFGKIFLAGEDIAEIDDKDAARLRNLKIGFIFQDFNLFPVMTARENVEYPCTLRKESRRNARRSAELLEMVGLADSMDKFPRQMSGGQRQRVAIARSLVNNPEIVFADEPTANLDKASGEAVMDLLKSINETLGATFVFSTHDQKIVDRATRVVSLLDGKIAGDKTRRGGQR